MKKYFLFSCILFSSIANAQNVLTPEKLWSLGRVSALGLSKDKRYVVYKVSIPDVAANKSNSKTYIIPVQGGNATEIANADSLLENTKISADKKYIISADEVQVIKTKGSDIYPELPKSNAYVFNSLNYRHWDEWEDGKFGHVFIAPNENGKAGSAKDIMKDEPYDCPQKPFGGDEDFIWNPDSKHVVYVCKKKFGTDYAISTNTDLYEYDVETGTTKNLTEGMMGYDINPSYSWKGTLAWLSQRRDGYEADKQDIIVWDGRNKINLTKSRDDLNVESFMWSDDARTIFFIAPVNGTLQLFGVRYTGNASDAASIMQLTKGDFDISGITAQADNTLILTRTDMNHAAEIYTLDLSTNALTQLTHVNDAAYNNIGMCKTERRFVTTTDGKKMLVWVIFPPDFDASKKYPSLLYCQGGPQSSLTQFYSFRWNFQLMASEGYIVVAPCRRGMPGFGTKWNEQVSKDWGGQVIRDYISAVDAVSKEPYMDKNRRGCIGASFGGFSVFALAAVHNHRFKTFIAHDGVFDFKSMYGTTDEMWFENWEKGGAYWQKTNAVAQRSFAQSPSNFVDKWDTPIMIVQGGKDYRVPIEQGQQAFQAAQLRGIKSRFLYLPDENHWVLHAQNAMVWQHEFYKWLDETLK